VRVEKIFGENANAHALSIREASKAFARLAWGRGDLVHFFFQPNPRTSFAARAVHRMRPRPTVHTVSSAPRQGVDLRPLHFADRTVVLSRATERRLEEAGVRGVVRIPPAVAPLEVPTELARAEIRTRLRLPNTAALIVFPGDLERGADLAIRAIEHVPDAILALAYRKKTPRAIDAERRSHELAAAVGVAERVHWVGETPQILSLLGASDVVVMPSRDLDAKVDLPVVLIEAMWQARPIIVARDCSAAELAEGGAAITIDADVDALATALSSLLGDPIARRAAGERARTAAIANHEPSRMAARYEALYDELLA
jgi:glycosyltransferase involved in cell wall biosynthesis